MQVDFSLTQDDVFNIASRLSILIKVLLVCVSVCVKHFFLEIHMFLVTSLIVISVMQLLFQIILSW